MHTPIRKVALGACSRINQWEGPGYVLSVSFNGKLVMHADLYIDFTVKGEILFTQKYWEKFYTRYDQGRLAIAYNNPACMFTKIKTSKWNTTQPCI